MDLIAELSKKEEHFDEIIKNEVETAKKEEKEKWSSILEEKEQQII